MNILGIESSCDECAASVVRNGNEILSSVIATQIQQHREFYGVVPELASRLHTELIYPVVEEALEKASIKAEELDGIAVTNRPGLSGSLMVGMNFAKGLSTALDIPFIGIDHILAHLYAPQLEHSVAYPYLGLLVSGGHTIICKVLSYDEVEVLGTTIDDSIGETYDKIAKFYNFGYPGGALIDSLAKNGNDRAFSFPVPRLKSQYREFDVSYSGLKTAVINQLDLFWNGKDEKSAENIAASFQRRAVDILMRSLKKAVEATGLTVIAAGGGVAANSLLRKAVQELAESRGGKAFFPAHSLCTDNGAMIGGLGYQYLSRGVTSSLDLTVSARVAEFKSPEWVKKRKNT